MQPTGGLSAGEVGYVATGFKSIREVRVGDTITLADRQAEKPLPGYAAAKPMVFAGIYPVENEEYPLLRDALEKLQLNDASLVYEPETSQALNFGFRCGFLGLFHMDIIQERLEREYDMDVIVTAPSVEYQIVLRNTAEELVVDSPAKVPDEGEIEEIREPWMRIQVFTPTEYIGPVMELVTQKRGEYVSTEYLDRQRVLLTYDMPLAELIVDFYNGLKSVTRGYASRDDAYHKGQALVRRLKEVIPRQLFAVPIQAAIGKHVLSRADVKAMRKDVLAKCYGGDVSRKKKLLEKQKKGKRRMKMVGQIEVPQDAFRAMLTLDED
jgi:GTP-binding protein LepA